MKTRHVAPFLLLAAGALPGCGERAAETGAADRPAANVPGEQPAFDAAARFVALSAAEDTTADDWFALAQGAREAGDVATSAEALELAASDLPAGRIALERARLQVARGDSAEAVASLRTMFDNGFTGVQAITGDGALNSLAGDPAYEALVAEMSAQAFPCEHDPAFAEFDFWVGDWDVHLTGGQLAGTNRIERAESGCVLTEHWTGASGGTGMSINYLDKSTDEWVQVWNSQSGTQISVRGGLTDEGMRLTGQIYYVASGTAASFRGLWTPLPDGRVRQYFEQLSADGETWAPWFEGFYTRRRGDGNTK